MKNSINKPRIVILDGATLTPHVPGQEAILNEPCWNSLQAYGEVFYFPNLNIKNALQGAEIAITNKVFIDEKSMAANPSLRYIGLTSTGTNSVDLTAAARHGVTVTNIPNYSGASVAQHVFALLLQLTQQTIQHHQLVSSGTWSDQADFCMTTQPLPELYGKVFGILGMGDIGQRTARIASAFGMKVIALSRSKPDIGDVEVTYVSENELFAKSDAINVCIPLNMQTEEFINIERLSRMKSSAFLINCSRGGVVDEQALANALNTGIIAGAGLDVLSTEPPPHNHCLLNLPNCIITPHIAWATIEARQRCYDILLENLKCYLKGNAQNVVKA